MTDAEIVELAVRRTSHNTTDETISLALEAIADEIAKMLKERADALPPS